MISASLLFNMTTSTAMVKLIGISGSLRDGSYNTALLRAASTMMPEGTELSLRSIKGIPLYDGDVETAEGIPSAVAELKEAIAMADGFILATPEYNHSMSGVLKNAIDWLSRPPISNASLAANGLRCWALLPAGSARFSLRMHGCLSCAPWGLIHGRGAIFLSHARIKFSTPPEP